MRIPNLVELTCQQVVELVTDYMSGDLDSQDRARLEQHFCACTWCMTYLDQMRRTVDWTRQLGAASPEPESAPATEVAPDPALLEMFRDWKRSRS